MLGSSLELVQKPKKEVTACAVSYPAPCVRPTNTVWELCLGHFRGRFMSLDLQADCGQFVLFSVTCVMTCMSSFCFMPHSSVHHL